jgi:hypothetical protein
MTDRRPSPELLSDPEEFGAFACALAGGRVKRVPHSLSRAREPP